MAAVTAPNWTAFSGLAVSNRLSVAKQSRTAVRHEQRAQRLTRSVTRAEYRRDSGSSSSFVSGFIIGGAIFGALGFLFSPQISKAILGENADGSPRRLPKWMEEEDSLEVTRRKMNQKIAELNQAIDSTSAQLRADDTSAQNDVIAEDAQAA